MLPRLGVNIDHLATLRQLRGTSYPSLLEAARLAEWGGAQQITVHLREDRRHIQDQDVKDLRKKINVLLNLEMAATPEMVKFSSLIKPDWVCLVPEKRKEVTTEGGLNVLKQKKKLAQAIKKVKSKKIKVSLFIEPNETIVKESYHLGADGVEFHTGAYAQKNKEKKELKKILKAARLAESLGLSVHVGHGLHYENVRPLTELTTSSGALLIQEYNIGHAIVCRAALVGLERAVREMVSALLAP